MQIIIYSLFRTGCNLEITTWKYGLRYDQLYIYIYIYIYIYMASYKSGLKIIYNHLYLFFIDQGNNETLEGSA